MRRIGLPLALITISVSLSLACKQEIDESKPAADPLEDPWVASIETGEDGELGELAAEPAPGEAPLGSGEAQPASAVLAAPTPATDEGGTRAPGGEGSEVEAGAGHPEASPKAAQAGSEPTPAGEGDAQPTPPAPEPEGAPAAELASDPAPAAEPEPEPAPPVFAITDFDGNYRYVGGSAQRQALADAIDAAANELNGLIRGIGRKRLTKTNPIDTTLDLVVTSDSLQTIFETGFDAKCVIDGPTITWSGKKEKYRVRVRRKGQKLVQIIEGPDGTKTTVFVLSKDKQRLTVHHKIVADKLPSPMTYKLSYARK
jgi:hypothetical protein